MVILFRSGIPAVNFFLWSCLLLSNTEAGCGRMLPELEDSVNRRCLLWVFKGEFVSEEVDGFRVLWGGGESKGENWPGSTSRWTVGGCFNCWTGESRFVSLEVDAVRIRLGDDGGSGIPLDAWSELPEMVLIRWTAFSVFDAGELTFPLPLSCLRRDRFPASDKLGLNLAFSLILTGNTFNKNNNNNKRRAAKAWVLFSICVLRLWIAPTQLMLPLK